MGWILQKLEGGGSMVLERVKEYPTVRFDIGEGKTPKSWFSTSGRGHEKDQRNSWRERIWDWEVSADKGSGVTDVFLKIDVEPKTMSITWIW